MTLNESTMNYLYKHSSIYVAIASYRDGLRCGRTLFSLFSEAKNPSRVSVGVVDQRKVGGDGGDDDESVYCIEEFCKLWAEAYFDPRKETQGAEEEATADLHRRRDDLDHGVVESIEELSHRRRRANAATAGGGVPIDCPYKANVRVVYMDALRDSKGPAVARARGTLLMREEEFCMQIDSHSLVAPSWDMLMLEDWTRAANEYGILTTYVARADLWRKYFDGEWEHDVPHICRTMWGESSMVRNTIASASRNLRRPKLTITIAAGYSFGKCHAERAVPNDPYLYHIFDGEEFSRYSRLWTRGYDTYTPTRNIVFHDYTPVPHKWFVDKTAEQQRIITEEKRVSHERLETLWHMVEPNAMVDLGRYGLGECRTFEQLVQFSGVDTRPASRHVSDGERCFDLPWIVPNYTACPHLLPPFAYTQRRDAAEAAMAEGGAAAAATVTPLTAAATAAAVAAANADDDVATDHLDPELAQFVRRYRTLPSSIRIKKHLRSGHLLSRSSVVTADDLFAVRGHEHELRRMLIADAIFMGASILLLVLCMYRKNLGSCFCCCLGHRVRAAQHVDRRTAFSREGRRRQLMYEAARRNQPQLNFIDV